MNTKFHYTIRLVMMMIMMIIRMMIRMMRISSHQTETCKDFIGQQMLHVSLTEMSRFESVVNSINRIE